VSLEQDDRGRRAREAEHRRCHGQQHAAPPPSLRYEGSHPARRIQVRVLPEHGAFELAKRRAGLQPELLVEHPAGALIGLERLGLPVAPVERDDEIAPERFPQRVLRDELLKLANDLRVVA
jgi:hypothetical protein